MELNSEELEKIIIRGILEKKDFRKQAVENFIHSDFDCPHKRKIFQVIKEHIAEYSKMPSLAEIKANIPEDELEAVIHSFREVRSIRIQSDNWLWENAEQYLKEKAMKGALLSYIDTDLQEDPHGIVQVLQDAKTRSLNGNNLMSTSINAQELSFTDFPELVWVVPDIIPEGLSILAGKPKLGKSFLMLAIAIAKAQGGRCLGHTDTQEGDVIYLSLEDGLRRLKSRMEKMMPGGDMPDNLYFFTNWKRSDEGGLSDLKKVIENKPNTKLVVIDTFVRVMRSNVNTKKSIYSLDYQEVRPFKEIADQYNVAVVMVHHTRKESSDDPMEQISGSTGLTGAADTLLVLSRSRGATDAELFVTGRDIEAEQSYALEFNEGRWKILGNAEEYRISKQRLDIINSFRENGNEEENIKGICENIERTEDYTAVKKLIYKMVHDGEVIRASRGKYKITEELFSSAPE